MAPPTKPSSSPTPPPTASSSSAASASLRPEDATTTRKNSAALSPGRRQRGSASVARSPSGLSLSRPTVAAAATSSTLSPSRTSVSISSSSNSNRPPSVYSASPSTASSAVDRATSLAAPSIASSSHNATGQSSATTDRPSHPQSSALGRLRRVASNVSIASSMRTRLTLTDAGEGSRDKSPAPMAEEEEVIKGSEPTEPGQEAAPSTAPLEDDESVQPSSEAKEEVQTQPESRIDSTAVATTAKRQLDVSNQAEKQARRKTWFGFGGADASPTPARIEEDDDATGQPTADEDHPMTDGEAAANNDGQQGTDDRDGQATIRGSKNVDADDSRYDTVKAWLPWRLPEAMDQATETGEALMRRYMSAGNEASSSAPSPAAGWGWNTWRAASSPVPQGGDSAPASTPHAADNASEAPKEVSDETDKGKAVAMELDSAQISRHKATHSEPTHLPHVTMDESKSSPAQASFINRWIPSWGRSAPSSVPSLAEEQGVAAADGDEDSVKGEDDELPIAAPGPPTPAERYKAEALAHLGAKHAVLNNATRSAWINYFGSRSAAPGPKTGQVGDEPEVMRISDGSTAPGKASTLPERSDSGATADGAKDASAKPENKQLKDTAPANSRPATPLTRDKEKARKVTDAAAVNGKKGSTLKPTAAAKPPPPNLILPTFDDTFQAEPRTSVPKKGVWNRMSSMLFNTDNKSSPQPRPSALLAARSTSGGSASIGAEAQERLPRLWSTLGDTGRASSRGCKGVRKVTVIGVHGWFSKGPIRNIFGEPTGTSTKFASMMTAAVKQHFADAGYALTNDDHLTSIALEADGQVSERVDKSFAALLSNPKWIADLLASDAVFVAAHSQGSIVATHLLARLVEQRHLDPRQSRVVLLCMCGIHNGPFAHLRGSITSYYMSAFETPAAKELFEFQNGHSPVSRLYAASLRIVLAAGIKLVYMASLDDQVVPLYSALHSAASHPSILRGLFCDGAAFPRVDFLTNLLSFCVQVRNAGLADHQLAALLSSSVAGSLYGGLGHSLIYDEPEVYRLAVRYLLEVSSPASYPTARSGQPVAATTASNTPGAGLLAPGIPPLELDDEFTLARNQKWNNNPYALPWSLRGLLEDESVRHYFSPHIDKLVRDYLDWQPTTKTLKDVQFRLEPIRLVAQSSQPATPTGGAANDTAAQASSNSKL